MVFFSLAVRVAIAASQSTTRFYKGDERDAAGSTPRSFIFVASAIL